MDLNATLLGQLITFAIFVAFTVKFIWPPLMAAISTRQTAIATGLAAAEQGVRELELARHKALEIIRDAKHQGSHLIEEANKSAGRILEEAKDGARQDAKRLLHQAGEEISQQILQAKSSLRKEVATLAIVGAEQILQKQVDKASNHDLLMQLVEEL
jgi:F-type H+-transporting ATPase subunit b